MYRNKKIAVVMPAYNAARTLKQTYDDLPLEIIDDVIVVDDASQDNTVKVAHSLGLYTVVHPKNRGYGGNQKTCYKTALKLGADVIVMIHPDHQYDPKMVPVLVKAIVDDKYLAVFGSRMIVKKDALAGGMPKWKFLFNILLTQIANLMLGTKLYELHSGLRAYDKKIFELIDIEKNSDNFVFDAQIIIQLANRHIPIKEIPIQTKYFPEASQIGLGRSIEYGLGILGSLALNVVRRR